MNYAMSIFGGSIQPNLLWVIATVFGALSAGTLFRLVSLRGAAKEIAQKRLASLRTWWLVAIAVVLAAVGGVWVAAVLFSVVSCLAMTEFAHLTRPQSLDRTLRQLACAVIVVGYVLLAWTADVGVLLVAPIAAALFASAWLATRRPVEEFTPKVAGVALGVVWTTTLPAMAVAILASELALASGGMLFLLLVGLTEINDIAAAIVGRRIGKTRLAPVLSPNKSWEGFAGGFLVTITLSALLGSVMTDLSLLQLVQTGIVISIAGTLGDLNMSAIKRCAKVKDSSDWLPGQGGVLDRIDSLTLSAPAFYVLVVAWEWTQ